MLERKFTKAKPNERKVIMLFTGCEAQIMSMTSLRPRLIATPGTHMGNLGSQHAFFSSHLRAPPSIPKTHGLDIQMIQHYLISGT